MSEKNETPPEETLNDVDLEEVSGGSAGGSKGGPGGPSGGSDG